MFKRIDHVEIVPSNIARTIAFYTEILGFKIQQRRKVENPPLEEVVFIELADILIELFAVKGLTPISTEEWRVGSRKIALAVEDMDRTISYLKTKGVEIFREPLTVGTMTRAIIKDPDGLSIELVQRG